MPKRKQRLVKSRETSAVNRVQPAAKAEQTDLIWGPFLVDVDSSSSPSQNSAHSGVGMELSDAENYRPSEPNSNGAIPPQPASQSSGRPLLSVAPEQSVDIGRHLSDSLHLWTPDPNTGQLVLTLLCPSQKCKNFGHPVWRLSTRRGRPYPQIVFCCNPLHIRGRPKIGHRRTAVLQWVPLSEEGVQGAMLEAEVELKARRSGGTRFTALPPPLVELSGSNTSPDSEEGGTSSN